MLHRLRKPLSAVLTLLLLICTAASAFAYELPEGARDTEFLTPVFHTELNYDEIEYVFMEAAPYLEEIDALRALMADAANAGEFESRFLALAEAYDRMNAMYVLMDHRATADGTDAWAAAEKERQYAESLTLDDAFRALVRDALGSPCADVITSRLRESLQAKYLSYQDTTEEELALIAQEQALISEYSARAAQSYTAEYNGKAYDLFSLAPAYYSGELDIETYRMLLEEVLRRMTEAYGDMLPEMIEVRNQIAAAAGYESCAAYCYRESHSLSYTPEETAAFCELVKKYISPIYRAYQLLIPNVDVDQIPEETVLTGVAAAEQLLPYFALLSDELWESAAYILEHKATDVEPGAHKVGTAYSSPLPGYNLPLVFANAYGTLADLGVLIHELGHANAFYWGGEGWNYGETVLDTMEVHSQGLEVLMYHFYPELYGDEARNAEENKLGDILGSIIEGCLYDELQRWAYATPGVTAEQISRKYHELNVAYGTGKTNDSDTYTDNLWVTVPHTFLSPFYYIGYATSAAGALSFWEASQTDYFAAVDDYLRFTALPHEMDLSDSFRAIGMESPLSESYLAGLAQTLREALLHIEPYTDVYADDPFATAIALCTKYELMNGVGGGLFAPDATATRAQGMTVLARMDHADAATLDAGVEWAVTNGISDGTDPAAPLTGEQFADMLDAFALFHGLDLDTEGAPTILTRAEMADMLMEYRKAAA